MEQQAELALSVHGHEVESNMVAEPVHFAKTKLGHLQQPPSDLDDATPNQCP